MNDPAAICGASLPQEVVCGRNCRGEGEGGRGYFCYVDRCIHSVYADTRTVFVLLRATRIHILEMFWFDGRNDIYISLLAYLFIFLIRLAISPFFMKKQINK